MRLKVTMAALSAVLATSAIAPDAALARHHHYYGRSDYRHKCGGGNGAVGTVGGGVGGALIGNAIGGPVATIAGGVGGALLGRHLDKKHTEHQNGC